MPPPPTGFVRPAPPPPTPPRAPTAARPAPRPAAPPAPPRGRFRNALAALLAVVATACLATAAVLSWTSTALFTPDGFAAVASDGVDDPALVAATNAILVTALAEPLGAAIAASTAVAPTTGPGFEDALNSAAATAASSPEALQAWTDALRTTQVRVEDLLDGAEPSEPEITTTTVTVDLTAAAAAARDQLAQSGFPAVGGVPVGLANRTVTADASAYDWGDLRDASAAWPGFLAAGLALTTVAFLLSTRKPRLTLLLGADLLTAAALVWLFARLAGSVAGDRGATAADQELLAALAQPYVQSLSGRAVGIAVIGGLVLLIALVLLSVGSHRRRDVASSSDRPAQGRTTA